MSIVEKMKNKDKPKKENPVQNNRSDINLSLQELEFLIRLIGDSNFKGKDLMFIFDLVKKLQDFYVQQKGAK
tara:strand:- start:1608 stop:1823 length:216 start_codon:yes stop_codon:yes gene_type:complete